jgi:hypothetical protein
MPDFSKDNGQLLREMKRDIFESLHCALPGKVVSFDAVSQTAVICPAVIREVERQGRFSRSRDGTARSRPFVPLPLLRDVPVFMPVPFEVQEGDACLVIFADRDIDAWFEAGEVEVPPSGRMHSLSDGFAFVGFRTRGNTDENAAD